MSDTVILALIGLVAAAVAGVPATIVAFAAYKQSIINGSKTDTVIEKATEIHTLTNSNLSLVTKNLEVALTKIAGLNDLVASLVGAKTVADRVAEKLSAPQLAAAAPAILERRDRRASDATGYTAAVVESLQQIDANTAATADNTALPTKDR